MRSPFIELITFIIENLKDLDEFLSQTKGLDQDLLIGLQGFLLALLVPMAIFLLEERDSGTPQWEKILLLRKVVMAKTLGAALLSSAFGIACWDIYRSERWVWLVFIAVGIGLQFWILTRAFRWMDTFEISAEATFRSKIRGDFLKVLDDDEALDFWLMVFSQERSAVLVQRDDFLGMYLANVRKRGLNDPDKSKLMNLINKNIAQLQLWKLAVQNQLLNFSFEEMTMPQLHVTSELEYQSSLRRLFREICRVSLNDGSLAWPLYQSLDKHFQALETPEPLKDWVGLLSMELFERLDEAHRSEAWNAFPPGWRVTSQNLQEKPDSIAHALSAEFLGWITQKSLYAMDLSHDWDQNLETVCSQLFPTVDKFLFTDLLVLHYGAFSSAPEEDLEIARVRCFLEHEKTFGHISGFRSLGHTDEEWQADLHASQAEIVRINGLTHCLPLISTPGALRKLIGLVDRFVSNRDTRIKQKAERLIADLEVLLRYLSTDGN